jgi:ribosome-associated heat shock protein Hsp15
LISKDFFPRGLDQCIQIGQFSVFFQTAIGGRRQRVLGFQGRGLLGWHPADVNAPHPAAAARQFPHMEKLRIDKWLWAARFYKTRTLASDEVVKGRVEVNGQEVKPARDVKIGDTVSLRQGPVTRSVIVRGLSGTRGPAPVAQQLYHETAESIEARERAAEQRRLSPEPAHSIEQGRPTKRGRRELDDAQRGWGDRWSASLDDVDKG